MAVKKDPREKQSEKLVIYVTPQEKRVAVRKAKGQPSVSAWAYKKLAPELK